MTRSLFVRMSRVKTDPALQSDARGARKLVVTRIYQEAEIKATAPCWSAPAPGQPCPVLELAATEMAVFNEKAQQQRHFHKQGTEIYVVVTGEMPIEVNGVTHPMQSGDAVIVGPGDVHEIKNQGQKFTSYVICTDCGGSGDKFPD